jgi:hypothetical protein
MVEQSEPRAERIPRHLERWLFAAGLVVCSAIGVGMACMGPGPAGYNIITGQGGDPSQPGSFGPTWDNISAGLATGLPFGLLVGGVAAGFARTVRWTLDRR